MSSQKRFSEQNFTPVKSGGGDDGVPLTPSRQVAYENIYPNVRESVASIDEQSKRSESVSSNNPQQRKSVHSSIFRLWSSTPANDTPPTDKPIPQNASNYSLSELDEKSVRSATSSQRRPSSVSPSLGNLITPFPGIVIKTKRNQDNNMKVFINICSHEEIPYQEETMATSSNEKDNSQYAEKTINMLINTPIEYENHKDHQLCIIYDIIIHPKELLFCQEHVNTPFAMKRLCEQVINSINRIFHEELNMNYVLLKLALNYKGIANTSSSHNNSHKTSIRPCFIPSKEIFQHTPQLMAGPNPFPTTTHIIPIVSPAVTVEANQHQHQTTSSMKVVTFDEMKINVKNEVKIDENTPITTTTNNTVSDVNTITNNIPIPSNQATTTASTTPIIDSTNNSNNDTKASSALRKRSHKKSSAKTSTMVIATNKAIPILSSQPPLPPCHAITTNSHPILHHEICQTVFKSLHTHPEILQACMKVMMIPQQAFGQYIEGNINPILEGLSLYSIPIEKMLIYPESGFVLFVTQKSPNRPIYLNICHNSIVGLKSLDQQQQSRQPKNKKTSSFRRSDGNSGGTKGRNENNKRKKNKYRRKMKKSQHKTTTISGTNDDDNESDSEDEDDSCPLIIGHTHYTNDTPPILILDIVIPSHIMVEALQDDTTTGTEEMREQLSNIILEELTQLFNIDFEDSFVLPADIPAGYIYATPPTPHTTTTNTTTNNSNSNSKVLQGRIPPVLNITEQEEENYSLGFVGKLYKQSGTIPTNTNGANKTTANKTKDDLIPTPMMINNDTITIMTSRDNGLDLDHMQWKEILYFLSEHRIDYYHTNSTFIKQMDIMHHHVQSILRSFQSPQYQLLTTNTTNTTPHNTYATSNTPSTTSNTPHNSINAPNTMNTTCIPLYPIQIYNPFTSISHQQAVYYAVLSPIYQQLLYLIVYLQIQHKQSLYFLKHIPYPKMGYLYKPGKYRGLASWKKRFFILENGYLTVYNDHNYFLLPQIKEKIFLKYKKLMTIEIDSSFGVGGNVKLLRDVGLYRFQIVVILLLQVIACLQW